MSAEVVNKNKHMVERKQMISTWMRNEWACAETPACKKTTNKSENVLSSVAM